jgi:esterase/lipase superfamily enzyme
MRNRILVNAIPDKSNELLPESTTGYKRNGPALLMVLVTGISQALAGCVAYNKAPISNPAAVKVEQYQRSDRAKVERERIAAQAEAKAAAEKAAKRRAEDEAKAMAVAKAVSKNTSRTRVANVVGIADRQQNGLVDIYFATSRSWVGNTHNSSEPDVVYFSNDWQPGPLSYGKCVAQIDPGLVSERLKAKKMQLPSPILEVTVSATQADKNNKVMLHSLEVIRSNAFFSGLEGTIRANKQTNILIAVHGYANSFQFAARRLAAVVFATEYSGVPVLYSWPSKGATAEYPYDEERILHPTELEQFVEFIDQTVIVAREAGATNVQLLAHSMGNRLLQYAAIRLAKRYPNTRLFEATVMAAPDVAERGFRETIWPSLQAISSRSVLYASAHDKPLFGSAKLHSGIRLGQVSTEFREVAERVIPGLELIIAPKNQVDFWAEEALDRWLNHATAFQTPGLRDLRAFLIGRRGATERFVAGTLQAPNPLFGQGWYLLPTK